MTAASAGRRSGAIILLRSPTFAADSPTRVGESAVPVGCYRISASSADISKSSIGEMSPKDIPLGTN